MSSARSNWSLFALSAILWASAQACSSESEPAPASACAVDCAAIAAPACSKVACNPETGQCEVTADEEGATCDDGLFCTVGDKCVAGACRGSPNDCGIAAPACRAVTCDEQTRACAVDRVADGVPCASEDKCVLGATCQEGACVGETKTCHFAGEHGEVDLCKVGVCNSATGDCDYRTADDGTMCDSFCAYAFEASGHRLGPTCQAGACTAPGVTGAIGACSGWDDECSGVACDLDHGGCYRVPVAAGKKCALRDACNTGLCDGAGNCALTPKNDGGLCSDGIACTTNDVCTSGVCKGTVAEGLTVYLSETFASHSGAWTTEAPWEIGRASGWTCGEPRTDHTDGTTDNGVASTIIGGYDGYVPHGLAYLVTPEVDVAAASSVTLRFFQSVGMLPPPWGEAKIEVFDGAAWVVLWEHLEAAACDTEWTKMSLDLTPYKNSKLRVRFGMAALIDDAPFTGWAIDDVAITGPASSSCVEP